MSLKRYGTTLAPRIDNPPIQISGSDIGRPSRLASTLERNAQERRRTAGVITDINEKFNINLDERLLVVTDEQATPQVRVRLGRLSAAVEDYGLEVFDELGATVFSATGLGANTVGLRELKQVNLDNLIVNPGFEMSDTSFLPHWDAFPGSGGTYAIDQTTPRSGGNCLSYDTTTQILISSMMLNGQGLEAIPVSEDDRIYFSFYYRLLSGVANQVSANVQWLDETGAGLGSSSGTFVTPVVGSWGIAFVATTDAPAGVAYARPYMSTANDGNAGVILFDDLYARRTVTTDIIDDAAITAVKVAVNAIATGHIQNLAINEAKLANLAVTTAKIADLNITETKIGNNSISTGKLQANAVTANEIAANTITANEIAANTITAAEIFAGTITATEIAAGTITTTQIAANTITAGNIAALTITAAEIAANTITAGQIASATITATEMNVATLSSISANIGTVTAGVIRDADSELVLDLNNVLLTVTDGQGTPQTRIRLGQLSASTTDYGLEIFDSSGTALLRTGSDIFNLSNTNVLIDDAALRVNNTTSSARSQLEETDLYFSSNGTNSVGALQGSTTSIGLARPGGLFLAPSSLGVELFSTGTVDLVDQPGCRLVRTASQSITGAGPVAVTFPTGSVTEDIDVQAMHDPATNSSRITVPTNGSGRYIVGGTVHLASYDDAGITISLRLNGTTTIGEHFTVTANSQAISVSTLYELADADYVELIVDSVVDTAYNVDTDTIFWVQKVA